MTGVQIAGVGLVGLLVLGGLVYAIRLSPSHPVQAVPAPPAPSGPTIGGLNINEALQATTQVATLFDDVLNDVNSN